MRFKIKYRTASGRVEEITVTADSPGGALVQAQLLERDMIKETIHIVEV